ncbi:hypothetical protein D3C86_2014460 [compost metagenome]
MVHGHLLAVGGRVGPTAAHAERAVDQTEAMSLINEGRHRFELEGAGRQHHETEAGKPGRKDQDNDEGGRNLEQQFHLSACNY